jgi:hypothetical protein
VTIEAILLRTKPEEFLFHRIGGLAPAAASWRGTASPSSANRSTTLGAKAPAAPTPSNASHPILFTIKLDKKMQEQQQTTITLHKGRNKGIVVSVMSIKLVFINYYIT